MLPLSVFTPEAQAAAAATANQKFIRLSPMVFNPSAGESTKITWNWEMDHDTTIQVMDGDKLVETLVWKQPYKGDYVVHEYQWNGKDKQGKSLPTGTYSIIVKPNEPKYEKWYHEARVTLVNGDAQSIYVAPKDDKRSNEFIVYGMNGSDLNVKAVQLTVTDTTTNKSTVVKATVQPKQWYASVTLPPYKQMKLEAKFTGGSVVQTHVTVVNHRFRLFDELRILALQYYNNDNQVAKLIQDNRLSADETSANTLVGRSLLVLSPQNIVPIQQEKDPLSNTYGVIDGIQGVNLLTPAHMGTGNMVSAAVDVMSNGSFPLFFSRIYNSRSDYISEFGMNWNHTYSYRLRDLGKQAVVMFEDGHTETFQALGNGKYSKSEGMNHSLSQLSDGTYDLSINNLIHLHFSKNGLLTKVVEKNNIQTLLYYEGTKLLKVQKNGQTINFEYNNAGQLSKVTGPGNKVVQYGFSKQQVDKVVLDQKKVWSWNYDADKRLTSVVQPSGKTLKSYAYDSKGRLIKETDATGNVSTLSYNESERTVVLTNPKKETATYYYDKDYRLYKIKDKNGTSTYQYNNSKQTGYSSESDAKQLNIADNNSGKKLEVTVASSTAVNSNVLKVQTYNISDLGKKDPTNTLHPMMRIYNTSQQTIDLADVTVRYYYTNDGKKEQAYWCDWSSAGCANVTGTFLSVSEKGDSALEVGFKSGAGKLKPGEYVEVHNRFNTKDWSDYIPTNDYSYNMADSYVDWDKVDAFYRGQLVWGAGSTGGTTPTPDPDPKPDPKPDPDPQPEPQPTDPNAIAASDNGERSIRAEMYNFNRSATYNTIYPWYRLVNESDEAIKLSDIRIRYFLTADTTESLIFWCDWASIGAGSQVKGKFIKVPQPDGQVDTVLEISFENQDAVIKPGESLEMHTRIGKQKWPDFTQTNDFSFNAKSTSYEPWNRIAVFVKGQFVWGQVPIAAADIAPPEDESLVMPDDYDKTKAVAVVDPLGNKTTNVYDANGNLTKMTNALGQTSTWTYNENSQVTVYVDGAGRETRYNYDTEGNLTEFIDGEGKRTSYAYNEWGLPTTITMPNGAMVTAKYDDRGNPVEVTDANGKVYKQTFDALNQLIAQVNPLGQEIKQQYNEFGQVERVQLADGSEQSYQYDEDGNLLGITRQDRQVNRYEYDAAGRTIAEIDALGQRTSYQYDALGLLVGSTDALGNTQRIVRDGLGRVTAEYDARNQKTEYQYDALGQLISAKGPSGAVTKHEYNAIGQQIRTIYADGSTDTYTYDGSGLLVEMNQQGAVTKYAYDKRGLLMKETNALGHSTTRTYDDNGQLLKLINAAGQATSYEYDTSGNLIKETDAIGQSIVYELDALGRTVAVTDVAAGTTTRNQFNDMNQLVRVVDAAGQTLDYTYDVMGRMLSETNALGQRTTYGYNHNGQLTTVTDAAGGVTSYRYDAGGNRIEMLRQDAAGQQKQVTTYTYDAAGNRLTEKNPIGEVVSYAYNAEGMLASVTDASGVTTRYTYDLLGRQIKTDYNGQSSESFAYDLKGNVIETQGSMGKTTYTYDALGQMLTSVDPNGRTVKMTWTPTGRKDKVIYPSGETVQYQYDALDRIQQVTDGKGNKTIYSYDANGQPSEKKTADGVKTSYGYTALGQLQTLKEQSASGSAIRSMNYEYDAAGNMTTKDETVRGVSKQYQYAYDVLGQLIQVKQGSDTSSYAYDAFGNRIRSEQTGSATASYDYNAANQLLKKTQGGETSLYEYDKRGNLISEKVNGQTAAKYTYNEANRLAKLEKDGKVTSYQYNVNGHRVKKTESGRATAYVLDPLSPYGETLETYVDGKRADSIVYGNERISVRNSQDKTYNYSLDHLGSVNELRSADGSVAQSYLYEEFGEMLTKPKDSSIVSAHFSYTGHEFDLESGLYYAKARYLDASLGRFVSEDTYDGTLTNPLSQNRYIYVENSPLINIDPSGNMAVSKLRYIDSFKYLSSTYSDSVISYSVIALNGKNPWTAFHEIAQLHVSRILAKKYGLDATLEYSIKSTTKKKTVLGFIEKKVSYEADIVVAKTNEVWEVKPKYGVDPKEQLELYKKEGNLKSGRKLNTIKNIPIYSDIYMMIEFPKDGYAVYSFYKKKGDKETSYSSRQIYKLVYKNLGEFENQVWFPGDPLIKIPDMPVPIPGLAPAPLPIPIPIPIL